MPGVFGGVTGEAAPDSRPLDSWDGCSLHRSPTALWLGWTPAPADPGQADPLRVTSPHRSSAC